MPRTIIIGVSIVAWLLGIFGVQAPAATIKLVNFYNNEVAIAFEGDIPAR